MSFAGEIADLWRRIKEPIFAYYLGGYNPSDIDLERDLREKIERYGRRQYEPDPENASSGNIVWQRLGVTIACWWLNRPSKRGPSTWSMRLGQQDE